MAVELLKYAGATPTTSMVTTRIVDVLVLMRN